MGFLQDIFSGGASNLVDAIGNTLDKVTTTKEEKLQLHLEMKKADMRYQVEMKKLSVEEKEISYKDVDSARQMSTAVQTSSNATRLSKNVVPVLAIGTTVLTFVLFGCVIFKRFDPQTKDIVIYLLGVLSAIVGQIFSFYFGSSSGSQEKNEIIKSMKM